MPQQPPSISAPASTSASISSANPSGPKSYTVFPSASSCGSPAFGFAATGISAYLAIFLTISAILPGPVEQFTPTAATPSAFKTRAAVPGSVPYNVRPSSLNVSVTITGRLHVSLTAITAARHSWRLIIVSTTIKSTPAS